jgi:hypothetical protein
MDPLTAVSLAGNIVQFVDFSVKLVTGAYEIAGSSTGRLAKYEEVYIIAQSITKLHENIAILSNTRLGADVLSRRDKNLLPLHEACIKVGNELICHLDQLRVLGSRKR